MATDDGVAKLRGLTHALARGTLAPAQRLAMVHSVVGDMAVGATNTGVVPLSLPCGTPHDAARHMHTVHSTERPGTKRDAPAEQHLCDGQRFTGTQRAYSVLPGTASPAVGDLSQRQHQHHQELLSNANVRENNSKSHLAPQQQLQRQLGLQASGYVAEQGTFMHPVSVPDGIMDQSQLRGPLLHQQIYWEYTQRQQHLKAPPDLSKQSHPTTGGQLAYQGRDWCADGLRTGDTELPVGAMAASVDYLCSAAPVSGLRASEGISRTGSHEQVYMPTEAAATGSTYTGRTCQPAWRPVRQHKDGTQLQVQDMSKQQQPARHVSCGPDSDEWLPGWHFMDHSMQPQQMMINDGAAGLTRCDSAAELEAVLDELVTCSGSIDAADSVQEAQPRKGRRIRRNKVNELQTKVDALTRQLTQLCDLNSVLRKKEQQLHGHLTDREREVTRLLVEKHKALTGGQGWQHDDEQAHGNGPPTSDQFPAVAAYRLSEPSLGYDPLAWREEILPTVNGGLVNPGVLPVFALLPDSTVQTAAKNISRFVSDVKELRDVAGSDPDSELQSALEEYLLARAAMLQGIMRRYNVLNPVFMYQLRAINLSTGKPGTPPAGHWSNMAELMRKLITAEDLHRLRMSYRSFNASLRAITKEQRTLIGQLRKVIQGLQSMPVIAAEQQQQQAELADSMDCDVIHLRETTPASSCSGIASSASTSSTSATPAAGAGGGEQPTRVSAASGISRSSTAERLQLPDETTLLEQMQVQQKVIELLEQLEQLLLREHDQHFVLLWSCTQMPGSIKVFMELLLASYPYLVNFHEMLPHLLGER